MLSKKFIDAAYSARGNELCKFVRAEVMEALEDRDLTGSVTEEEYNTLVSKTMARVKLMTGIAIDIIMQEHRL